MGWMLFFLLPAATHGCRLEDSFFEANEAVQEDTGIMSWTLEQNQWIYSKMKYHYFWNKDLKDSLEYDFTLEPGLFFESMKVPQDRFSYCTVNDEYIDTKAENRNQSISRDSVYVLDGHKIGYFQYTKFAEPGDVTDIAIAFHEERIEDLVVDLRGNPGGAVETCLQLASYIVPLDYLGQVFCRLQYNEIISEERARSNGSPYSYYYLKDDINTRNRNLGLSRVVFLADRRSASCSELLINCLKPYLPVILIGATTTGKDVGMYAIKGRKYKYVLEPITFRSYNANDEAVPETGIVPDILIEQSPYVADGITVDPALEAAFTYLSIKETNSQSI